MIMIDICGTVHMSQCHIMSQCWRIMSLSTWYPLCIECATDRLISKRCLSSPDYGLAQYSYKKDHCSCVHQEEIVHALCECPSTLSIRTHFQEMLSDILLPDLKYAVLILDSVAPTLKLFIGAPIETIFYAYTDKLFLRTASSFIVSCVDEFVSWSYTIIRIPCVHVCSIRVYH